MYRVSPLATVLPPVPVMAEGFDPYHIWLAIPPEDQPPHHYRLLGVKAFEANVDVLESAADQRMVHVRSFQTGKHAAESQKLLNELAAARLCLLSPEKRQAYDKALRGKLAAEIPPAAAPPPAAPPRPLAKARPLKAAATAPAAQVTSPLGFDPLERATPRRGSKKRAASTSPAIYAVIGVGLLAAVAVAWIALSGMGTSEQSLAARNPAAPRSSASPESPRDEAPALSRSVNNPWLKDSKLVDTGDLSQSATDPMATVPPSDNLAQTDDSVDEDADDLVMPAAAPKAASTLAADQRPESPGGDVPARTLPTDKGAVIADKLVVWNCNNDRIGDRGMLSCNVELRKAGKVVWAKKAIPLAWSQDEEPATAIPLPKISFDALRVETASYQGAGSAICEVEIFRGETNIARGKTVTTSGDNNINVPAANVVDGVRNSSRRGIGYWAAPNDFLGWVEVQVAAPTALEKPPSANLSAEVESKPSKAGGSVTADKLVLWNCKNHRWSNAGTLTCNIELRKAGKVVWSKKDISLAWSPDDEPATTIRLPKIAFDALRVESITFQLSGTALCEVEIFRGQNNIALGKPATVSASFDRRFPATAVVDGIKDSSREGVGYWLGPDRSRGWVEVQVAPSSAPLGKTVYLSELPAIETRIIGGSSLSDRQSVAGVTCEHGLLAHPDHNSSSHVAFQLDKSYRMLSGAAGILDRVQRSATPLTFRIVGDGNELWRETIQEAGAGHPLNINVAGVSKLELLVDCPGSADQAHAMWVDLELTRVAASKANANKTSAEKQLSEPEDNVGAKNGFIADKLVLWNTHNNDWNDRGMLSCNIELQKAGQTVWSKKAVTIDWLADEDPATTVPLPAVRFDTLRVETLGFQNLGTGLCEIEVLRGKENLARGKRVTASGVQTNSPLPDALVDGIRDSSRRMFGYWLGPDRNNAWVEVHLDAASEYGKPVVAKSAKSGSSNPAGVVADKLLVWNCNNYQWKDRGMLSCNVELRMAGEVVWSQSAIPLDWSPDEETATSIRLPKIKFDSVRLETASFFNLGTGLCEIEVLRGTTNLARGKPVIASGTHRDAAPPTTLTDGVKDSSGRMSGYWLGPDTQRPWIEVQVAP